MMFTVRCYRMLILHRFLLLPTENLAMSRRRSWWNHDFATPLYSLDHSDAGDIHMSSFIVDRHYS